MGSHVMCLVVFVFGLFSCKCGSGDRLCPLDSHDGLVSVVCAGKVHSRSSSFLNWTIQTVDQSEDRTGQISCNIKTQWCYFDGYKDVQATLSVEGETFLSVLTFKRLPLNQEATRTTCIFWDRVETSVKSKVALCAAKVAERTNVPRCTDLLSRVSGLELRCKGHGSYCFAQEGINPVLINPKKTGDEASTLWSPSPTTFWTHSRSSLMSLSTLLKSVCRRSKESPAQGRTRYPRDVLSWQDRVAELKTRHLLRRSLRSVLNRSVVNNLDSCKPVFTLSNTTNNTTIDCYDITISKNDDTLTCQVKGADVNVTCYNDFMNWTKWGIYASPFSVKKVYADNRVFCLCYFVQDPECGNASAILILPRAHLNQSCTPAYTKYDVMVTLYYVVASVLSVVCFIFVSSTCIYVCRNGSVLYTYYYFDVYRRIKRELRERPHQKGAPPIPPPRLPPRGSRVRGHLEETRFDDNRGLPEARELCSREMSVARVGNVRGRSEVRVNNVRGRSEVRVDDVRGRSEVRVDDARVCLLARDVPARIEYNPSTGSSVGWTQDDVFEAGFEQREPYDTDRLTTSARCRSDEDGYLIPRAVSSMAQLTAVDSKYLNECECRAPPPLPCRRPTKGQELVLVTKTNFDSDTSGVSMSFLKDTED
ncbi:hypothetical protein Bpfe_004439 [Biomphalaria pfeifferi]|uniref:Uncharacterized protein n=1 Tax=Biomphalaria pfeifferi TaxID=112525 RepID=A0AAD8FJL5_BIOPF|nr:hypothetical protein Bpfe_004439 [Biomphalaria pfeifferi]